MEHVDAIINTTYATVINTTYRVNGRQKLCVGRGCLSRCCIQCVMYGGYLDPRHTVASHHLQ